MLPEPLNNLLSRSLTRLHFEIMKRYSLILALVLICLDANGQAPPQLAGFVLANATGLKAQLLADSKNLIPGGIDPGTATSGIPLPVGPHQMEVSVPGLPPAKTPLSTATGTCPIFVAYLEETVDPTSKQTKKTLRLMQLPSKPQKERYLTSVISFNPSRQPIPAKVNGKAVNLEYQKAYIAEGRRFVLAENADPIDETEYGEKSSQFCLVFKGADNKLKSILVPDMIYTW